jgi:glucose/arabinose dehydrogenase
MARSLFLRRRPAPLVSARVGSGTFSAFTPTASPDRAADLHGTICVLTGMDRCSFVALHVITIDFAAEVDIMRFDAAIRSALSQLAAVTLPVVGVLLVSVASATAQDMNTPANAGNACAGDNGGVTLSPGFCATVFADNVGHARHMVVAPNGVVYVNTWSGRYYANTENAKAPDGGFLLALQDTTGSGRADKVVRFGPGVESGNAGGTGIALYNGALFAETNDRIVRYALPPGAITPTGAPEVVVSGLPLTGDHPMHPFKIDAQGALFVDLGSSGGGARPA